MDVENLEADLAREGSALIWIVATETFLNLADAERVNLPEGRALSLASRATYQRASAKRSRRSACCSAVRPMRSRTRASAQGAFASSDSSRGRFGKQRFQILQAEA